MDSETTTPDGAKFTEKPGETGAGSEQLTAQQSIAPRTAGVLTLLFALSQHFIILSLRACRGVPARTPPTSVDKIKKAVTKRFISKKYNELVT